MRILVATDFSPSAETAHALVRAMKLPEGSHVRLVHAIEPMTTIALFAPAAITTITDAAESDARAQVTAVSRTLAAAGVTADGVVAYGRAADVVIDEAVSFQPDLLVVGSRGRGGVATAVLGSVSAELVDRASCPVLVARRPALGRVVLADDGSANAAEGARILADLPPLAESTIHVVSVVDVPFPVVLADPTGTGAAVDAFRAYQESMPALRTTHAAFARERAEALGRAGIGATWEQREGDAASELIAAAKEKDADCIVVGSRGQTGLRRLVIGSVARGVLFSAPCSVLVVHPKRVAATGTTTDGRPVTAAR